VRASSFSLRFTKMLSKMFRMTHSILSPCNDVRSFPDGKFKDTFEELYQKQYKADFEKNGLWYEVSPRNEFL
jgi:hypothetical protein